VYVIPMMNPDGAEYDMSGGVWHKWRKNRQPIPGSTAIGIDLNRQFGYTWNCCPGGASTKPSSDYYEGPSAFYAPEDQAYRDFVNSQVVNGKSKITEILSLHSAAKEVLWPYSYTKTDVPSDMTLDDHNAFVALGKGIASRDGYKPQQGSDLYIVSGDQDDWAYGTHGIFAITIELPKGAANRYYPTLSEVNKFNSQNLNAVLWYLKQADCPYAAAGLASKYCGNSSNQQYYSESVFNQAAVQPQQTNCWCAVASTRATLESIDASISVAQTDVNDYMTAHDKNNWTDPAFSDYVQCVKGTPSPSYAHDSRGMAWALWNWATTDKSVGFNDYAGGNQANMDWRVVYSIRANGYPVGASVVHGEHEILVVGYQTALDPFKEDGQANAILGMDVWDPWYNAGFGNWSGWPAGGFAPNSFVTLGDWNTKYFTTDLNEGPYYQGKYVVVMQSSVAQAPSDTPAQSYGDVQYALANPAPSPTPSPSPTDSPPPSSAPSAPSAQLNSTPQSLASSAQFAQPAAAASIAQAVADGLTTYGLLGDRDLGNLPSNYTIGTTVHVNSLVAGIPSYDLAEIRVNDVVKAVALVDEVNGGYRFGELRATTADVRLPTTAQMSSALAAKGLRGTPSLSWTWTDDPAAPPPFAPFLTGTDAFGRTTFVTPAGVDTQLNTVNGVTSTAN
jgi:hypothetical protein